MNIMNIMLYGLFFGHSRNFRLGENFIKMILLFCKLFMKDLSSFSVRIAV